MNGLIFVGYQFSWFSWRVRCMKSSTHEKFSVWIMKENAMATNSELQECVNFAQTTKKKSHPQCSW